jgi:DNA-binding MarR family transcriptional regulator
MPTQNKVPSFEYQSAPGHLIRRAQQIAVALFVEETQVYDITPVQFAMLSELAQRDSIDQATLAARIAVDVATLGQVARRLQERDLIRRQADGQDQRRKLLALTPAGRSTLNRLNTAVATAQARIVAPLTAREQATFARLLQKLVHQNNEQSRAPMRRVDFAVK